MAARTTRRVRPPVSAKGSLLRSAMLLLVAIAAAALVLAGWGMWRLERGQPLPDWLSRLAVLSGLVSGEQLTAAVRAADDRRVADAVWRNEAANRARGLADVRAVAWDGDRLLVMLAPGVSPTGAKARAVCVSLALPKDAEPVRVRLVALDGQDAPVEAWCGEVQRD